MAAKPLRSTLYLPTSSAAMCCASAALPPLPKIKIFPPFLRLSMHRLAAISSGLAM